MIYTDLLFVFAFLPVTIILSLFDRSAEYKNLILVVSSVVFFSWGRPIIVVLLFATVLMDFLFGLGASNKNKLIRGVSLALDIMMNVGVFVVFARNYLFADGGAFERFGFLSFSEKLIPIGIGYYTIRGISYVSEVFRGRTEVEKNPFCLITYMLSFHLMFVGPVVRYSDVTGEIRWRKVGASEINSGLTRFIKGLGKAVVLAPVFEKLMDSGLDFENMTTLGAVAGMVGFLGYYYWSFAGFTDMAIGLGRMNGFHYRENLKPFRVTEGIGNTAYAFNGTLTGFLADGIVHKGDKKWLYAITGLLCSAIVGLWYGFSKGTVCGAIFIGVFVVAEKLLLEKRFEKIPKAVIGIYTTAIMLVGACAFYFDSLWKLKKWVFACLGKGTAGFSDDSVMEIIKGNYVLIIFGILAALPIVTDGVKKLCAVVSEKFGYSVLRVSQTVCTTIILCMYTVEAYNLVK